MASHLWKPQICRKTRIDEQSQPQRQASTLRTQTLQPPPPTQSMRDQLPHKMSISHPTSEFRPPTSGPPAAPTRQRPPHRNHRTPSECAPHPLPRKPSRTLDAPGRGPGTRPRRPGHRDIRSLARSDTPPPTRSATQTPTRQHNFPTGRREPGQGPEVEGPSGSTERAARPDLCGFPARAGLGRGGEGTYVPCVGWLLDEAEDSGAGRQPCVQRAWPHHL